MLKAENRKQFREEWSHAAIAFPQFNKAAKSSLNWALEIQQTSTGLELRCEQIPHV